jgi:hypothetical protein
MHIYLTKITIGKIIVDKYYKLHAAMYRLCLDQQYNYVDIFPKLNKSYKEDDR